MEIRLQDLMKVFVEKDGKETIAVNNLNYTIPSGKLIGLLGPSGCGKTTTLFMLAGLHTVSSGKIFFDGADITRLTPDKRGVGVVFQNYALYPHMTVRQNIMFPLENLKVSLDVARVKMLEAATLVGIEMLLDRKPAQLSGGQQQRVAIARALVKQPQLLLLDEPLSNLDARLRLQTREEIRRIQIETGITTVFVTHDQEEAMSISDEIVVMDQGNVQQIGRPQDVYNNPNNVFVAKFLGNPPINTLDGIIKNNIIYLNDNKVGMTKSPLKDGNYIIGIRPEDFKIAASNDEYSLKCDITYSEHIGRDTMLKVNIGNQSVRLIVGSEDIEDGVTSINLVARKNKIHVFDKVTGVNAYVDRNK